MEAYFWLCAILVFYAYLGYPMILTLMAWIRPRPVQKVYEFPSVSVVIAAFNEEKNMGSRIENLLGQDYPPENMEVIVVSDGSSDRTEEIVRSYESKNVKLYALGERKGKAEALNYGVSKAAGEILVFADARQTLKIDAVKELVANLSDPAVGAVSGELFLTPADEGHMGRSIGMYWGYEKWVRKKESLIDSVVGVTGAIYAIRRDLYEPIPRGTILDDVLVPMRIALKGFRVVLDEAAQAYDSLVIRSEVELKRKIRTLMGNFQLLVLLPETLSVRKNRLFLYYVSHKLLRLLVPYFLISLFAANLFLHEGVYSLTLALQIFFYLSAFVGYLLNRQERQIKYFAFAYTIVLLNYAAVLGLISFIKKNEEVWVAKGQPL